MHYTHQVHVKFICRKVFTYKFWSKPQEVHSDVRPHHENHLMLFSLRYFYLNQTIVLGGYHVVLLVSKCTLLQILNSTVVPLIQEFSYKLLTSTTHFTSRFDLSTVVDFRVYILDTDSFVSKVWFGSSSICPSQTD